MKLDRTFYDMPATEAAAATLGKLICRQAGGKTEKYRISETECYFGESDTACHAHRGKTARCEILYSRGGVAYVYLCYGIHNLLNIVTGCEGHPEAVLIRGIEGFDGPGRLTKELGVDRSMNGENLITSDRLWLEDDGFICTYTAYPRVGIDYAEAYDRERLWRFRANNIGGNKNAK